MGFFNDLFGKKDCVHCGKACGMFQRVKTKDKKVLCKDCVRLAGPEFKDWEHTYDQFLVFVERNKENENKLAHFQADKSFYNRIFIDTEKQQVAITGYSASDLTDMRRQHPHVYDLKDLKFFTRTMEVTKQEDHLLLGTEITFDISVLMAFKDKLVPCPLNGKVVCGRKATIKGVIKKRIDGAFDEKDAELVEFAYDVLKQNGINIPPHMEKGDNVEIYNDYASYFTTLFEMEREGILSTSATEGYLDEFVEKVWNKGAVKNELRKRFGRK